MSAEVQGQPIFSDLIVRLNWNRFWNREPRRAGTVSTSWMKNFNEINGRGDRI
jgi:hypothetical protein